MKSLITGGAGFIGSHLADYLFQKGHKIIVLDNFISGRKSNLKKIEKKIKIVNIDIFKSKSLDKYFKGVDYVFHLAGLADIVPSIENPKKYFDTNVVGTFNVLRASKKAKVKKLLYAASASCYGLPKSFPTNENSEIKPMYPYALTKRQGEELVMHWNNIFNLPSLSLRFFNCYGPRSRTTGAYGAVFGVFLAQKLAGKPLTIVGNGKQTRDFIHVSDLVKALFKAAKSKEYGKIYNLAGGKEISVNQIANLIGGKKIFIPKRPGEPDRSLADIRKIKKDLKWKPLIKISDGIKDLLLNIENYKDAPIWTPVKIKKATKSWFKLLQK